jgi:hypothetical protein
MFFLRRGKLHGWLLVYWTILGFAGSGRFQAQAGALET